MRLPTRHNAATAAPGLAAPGGAGYRAKAISVLRIMRCDTCQVLRVAQ